MLINVAIVPRLNMIGIASGTDATLALPSSARGTMPPDGGGLNRSNPTRVRNTPPTTRTMLNGTSNIYSKVAMAKLYTTKTPITAADLLNDRVLPFFEEHGMGVIRMLTDRGTEYCGKPETHDYQFYLALNDIEHTKTKAQHPQANGICESFHKTILQEFYQVAFRRKLYLSLDELQSGLDAWLAYYNNERAHQGKMCCGRTPLQTLIAGEEAWNEKVTNLNSI